MVGPDALVGTALHSSDLAARAGALARTPFTSSPDCLDLQMARWRDGEMAR